jgi:choice-of-anchor B domain-containing protein
MRPAHRSPIRVAVALCASAAVSGAFVAHPARAAFGDITLVGQLTLPASQRITDVWGYTDTGSGKNYALVGDWVTGVHIVDVSNPAVPVYVLQVTGIPGFDVKAWGHHMYVCDGNQTGLDSRIVDLGDINSPQVLSTKFLSAHNIAISEAGTMYLEYLGLTAYDIATDPTQPDSLWHVVSNGHDATPDGNLLYDFTGYDKTAKIWNVANPAVPVLLGTVSDPLLSYSHSGDADKTGRYLYLCDELAVHPQADIVVYDITNPAAAVRVTGLAEPSATVHNLYVIGDLAFVSYYHAGFRTLDVTNPASPTVADTYDTSAFTGEGYNGAFGVYPFAEGGLVYVSDHPNGLYIFSVEGYNGPPTVAGDTPRAGAATLGQNFPNPFNPTTTIDFTLAIAGPVRLDVFDVHGTLVRTLLDGVLSPGTRREEWNGTDGAGRAVPSGVYYYRLSAGRTELTRKMVLLK